MAQPSRSQRPLFTCRITFAIKDRKIDVVASPTATFAECFGSHPCGQVLADTGMTGDRMAWRLTRTDATHGQIEVHISTQIASYNKEIISVSESPSMVESLVTDPGPVLSDRSLNVLEAALVARKLRERRLWVGPPEGTADKTSSSEMKRATDDFGRDRVAFLRACFNGELAAITRLADKYEEKVPFSAYIVGFRGACAGAFVSVAKYLLTRFRPRAENGLVGIGRDEHSAIVGPKASNGEGSGDGTISDLLVFVAMTDDEPFLHYYLDKFGLTPHIVSPGDNYAQNVTIAAQIISRRSKNAATIGRMWELLPCELTQVRPLAHTIVLPTDWSYVVQYGKPEAMRDILRRETKIRSTGGFAMLHSPDSEKWAVARLLYAHELGLS